MVKEPSALLTMMLDQAVQLTKDDEAAERGVPTTIEQRICIGLIQARALECRHLAGMLMISGAAAKHRALMAMSVHLRERSHKLETLGLALSKNWPPTGDEFGEEERMFLQ